MPTHKGKHKGKKVYKRGTGKYRRYRDDNQRQKNVDRRLLKKIRILIKKHPDKSYKIRNNNIYITNRPKVREE